MHNVSDAIRAVLIGIAVALPVAFLLALLKVSYERRDPIPWADMWRALTGKRRG